MEKHSSDQENPRYAWLMVAVVFTISALAFGALGSISVFLKPLASEFGWGRGQTSLGYTTISFSSAVFGILWGFVADRYGTRWFGVVAAIVMSFSLFMLSRQDSISDFYAYYFLFGAFGTAMATTPLYANVGFWFRMNPGLALGITAAGGAVGQALVPYLCGLSITAYGWQETYEHLALSYLIIALPIGFLIRESPWRERVRLEPDAEVRHFPLSEIEVIAWISVAVIFCCNCMAVPIVHLVPMLTDQGNTLEYATRALFILMIAGALGRIVGGRLADMIGTLPAYILMSFGQTVSVMGLILARDLLWIYLFRGDVLHSDLYSYDGQPRICGSRHVDHFLLRLGWYGDGWFCGRILSRRDRKLRVVIRFCECSRGCEPYCADAVLFTSQRQD